MAWSTTGTEIQSRVRYYAQSLGSEMVPTAFIVGEDGVRRIWSWVYNRYVLKTKETTTEWRGMTEAAAKSKAQTIGSQVTLGGSGDKTYESYSRTAEAHRLNAANEWGVTQVVKESSVVTA